MVKKLAIALMLAVSLIVGGCKKADAQEVVEPTPTPTFEFDLGISGDVFYLLTGDRSGKLVEGASLKVANIYGELISVNVIAADMLSEDRSTLVGIGASVNIPLLVNDVLKGSWVANAINPSIGIAGLADLNSGVEITPALHIQVIKYEF